MPEERSGTAGEDAAAEYLVRGGDNLSEIARRHGVADWQALVKLNKDRYPGLEENPGNIQPGWVLRVRDGEPLGNAQNIMPQGDHAETTETYTVKGGDNLSTIAAKNGISDWQSLVEWNRDRYPGLVDRPEEIKAGWELRLEGTAPRGHAAAPRPDLLADLPRPAEHFAVAALQQPRPPDSVETYTVEGGDSLSTIAAKNGISDWRELVALNKDTYPGLVDDPGNIQKGWKLKLREAAGPAVGNGMVAEDPGVAGGAEEEFLADVRQNVEEALDGAGAGAPAEGISGGSGNPFRLRGKLAELAGALEGVDPVRAAIVLQGASHLGVKETGENRGPDVDRYITQADGRMRSGVPWCAVYGSWSIDQVERFAGIGKDEFVKGSMRNHEILGWIRKNHPDAIRSLSEYTPQPGDFAIIDRVDPEKPDHFTLFAYAKRGEGGTIEAVTIDGNSDDSVASTERTIDTTKSVGGGKGVEYDEGENMYVVDISRLPNYDRLQSRFNARAASFQPVAPIDAGHQPDAGSFQKVFDFIASARQPPLPEGIADAGPGAVRTNTMTPPL